MKQKVVINSDGISGLCAEKKKKKAGFCVYK